MKVSVNLRHLEKHGLRLCDEVSAGELELESLDELIRFDGAVHYDLEVQKLDQAVLVQGRVSVGLECECARCLRPFLAKVELVDLAAHLPLTGEGAVAVENDCVDLTPFIREDIFLALPQHPLCSKDCRGLMREGVGGVKSSGDQEPGRTGTSTWANLDELNL